MAPPGGFVIETVEDGRQALEVAQVQRPDLVFLDLLMPGVGGREVIDSMRKLPALADVPIVVVSAQIDLDSEMSKPGLVTLETPRGLRLDEIVGLIESIFSSLRIDPKPARASDSGPVSARLD
jgi:CheY-like chemotaxis protein